MEIKFVDTPYKRAILYPKDLARYDAADSYYRDAVSIGKKGINAIHYVAKRMGISHAEAGHLVKTDTTKLDSFDDQYLEKEV